MISTGTMRGSARLMALAAPAVVFLPAAGCAGGAINSGGGGTGPPPTITLTVVSPYNAAHKGNGSVVAGDPAFTLLAGGTGFTASSEIQWKVLRSPRHMATPPTCPLRSRAP